MPNREWDVEDDVFLGICNTYEQKKPVRQLKDPYIEEVYPKEMLIPEPFCRSCWRERKDEV
jgi:hypothetical protein